MLKPVYSLTRQRNIQRVTGTLIGGVIGFVLLFFSLPAHILFAIMVVLMIATYSFQRIKYMVSVICMTPFLLILFHFLGGEFVGVLKERVIDTVIGCIIALLAGYLLFPKWEFEGIRKYIQNMLKANAEYLQKVTDGLCGKTISITEYKLARKEVHINSANLSAAFQRMLSEPKNKQKNKNEIHQLVVLNHTLFSNVATIASSILVSKTYRQPEPILRTARKALHTILDSLKKLGNSVPGSLLSSTEEKNKNEEYATGDVALKEQLEFIYKLTLDINKIVGKITSDENRKAVGTKPD
jgi:uncharacterized membrane protein YccC